MVAPYLPTIDHSLWPCVALLVIFIPVSIWHERHWRRTLAEYADMRRDAGADDAEWPDSELRMVLGLQPALVAFATVLLAGMVLLGAVALFAWPHFDRPYLSAMLVAGVATVVGALVLVVDLWCSPWHGVAFNIRRAVHAPAEKRAARLAAALELDPDLRSRD